MKYRVKKGTAIDDIRKYLSPVIKYGEEKQRKNMTDDWDELKHTLRWLEKILDAINRDDGDILDIYYLEENAQIIGALFVLSGNKSLKESLASDGVFPSTDHIAQLTCFHIIETYRGRGIGRRWIENEVFRDLKLCGVQKVYIKSSHHQALRLYEKIGTVVGNYIGVSDHELYQRYGYIFEIDL